MSVLADFVNHGGLAGVLTKAQHLKSRPKSAEAVEEGNPKAGGYERQDGDAASGSEHGSEGAGMSARRTVIFTQNSGALRPSPPEPCTLLHRRREPEQSVHGESVLETPHCKL